MISKQKRTEIELEYRKPFEQVAALCIREDRMSPEATAKMLGVDIEDVKKATAGITAKPPAKKTTAHVYFVEATGRMMKLTEVSAEFGVCVSTLQGRVRKIGAKDGGTLPDWAIKPVNRQAAYVWYGKLMTISHIARDSKLPMRHLTKIIKDNGIPVGGEIPTHLLGKGGTRKYRYDGKLRTVREIAWLTGKTAGGIRTTIAKKKIAPFQSLDFIARHDHKTKTK